MSQPAVLHGLTMEEWLAFRLMLSGQGSCHQFDWAGLVGEMRGDAGWWAPTWVYGHLHFLPDNRQGRKA